MVTSIMCDGDHAEKSMSTTPFFLRFMGLKYHCCFAFETGDASQDISQSTTEDVALVSGHLQRLLDGVGESVAGESEVLEHDGV